MAMGPRPVENTKFELYELDRFPTQVKTAGALASGGTSVKFLDVDGNNVGQYLRKDDLFRIGDEIIAVATTTGASATTITRGVAGTTAAAYTTATKAIFNGSSRPENAEYRDAISIIAGTQYNYTQLHEGSWGVTKRQQGTKSYEGNSYENNQMAALDLFKQGVEDSLLFGVRAKDSGTFPKSYTGGFLGFATSNNFDYSAASVSLTLDLFLEHIYDCCEYGSDRKIIFASKELMFTAQQWFTANDYAEAKVFNVNGTDQSFRLNVLDFSIFDCNAMMVAHRQLSQKYAGYGLIADMDYLKLAEFDPMKIEENIQTKRQYTRKEGGVSWDVGLHFSNTKAHGVIKGVS